MCWIWVNCNPVPSITICWSPRCRLRRWRCRRNFVVHPRGVLLWEAGAVPESERVMEGTGALQVVIRLDKGERHVTLGPSMLEQMAQSG